MSKHEAPVDRPTIGSNFSTRNFGYGNSDRGAPTTRVGRYEQSAAPAAPRAVRESVDGSDGGTQNVYPHQRTTDRQPYTARRFSVSFVILSIWFSGLAFFLLVVIGALVFAPQTCT